MQWLWIFLLIFPAAIFLVHLGILSGVLAGRIRDRRVHGGGAQRAATARGEAISVIVVARNEEKLLPALLESLSAQTVAGFQTVLINDRSSDRTPAIMEEYGRRQRRPVTVLHNSADPVGGNPKQVMLDRGVRAASGEILFFTDADCILPPRWIEAHLRYFNDPRVGVVFGQISMPPDGSFLARYQAFDQPLIHQYSSGSAGIGLPTGCFGNNLVARRKAVEEVGGFLGLGYTLTEDAALIAAVGKRGWKVAASCTRETMIETLPKGSWRDFIHQHVRWNSGGFWSDDFSTRLSYRFIVLYLVASLLLLPFAPLLPLLLAFPLTSLVSIGMLAVLPGLFYRRDRWLYFLRLIPYTLFFMSFYSLVTVLSCLRLSPEWKGARLRTRLKPRRNPHRRPCREKPASEG